MDDRTLMTQFKGIQRDLKKLDERLKAIESPKKAEENTSYKDRIKEEYKELVNRTIKLNRFIEDIRLGKISLEKNKLELLVTQSYYMEAYAGVLRDRAKLEGIALPDYIYYRISYKELLD